MSIQMEEMYGTRYVGGVQSFSDWSGHILLPPPPCVYQPTTPFFWEFMEASLHSKIDN